MKADLRLRTAVLTLWKSKRLLKPLFGKLSKPDGHRALSLFAVIAIVALLLLPTPVSAAPSVAYDGEHQFIPPFYIEDFGDYYEVNNGRLITYLYKAGYNVLYDRSRQPLVYNEQFSLEYQQGTKWKQRGTPIGLDYEAYPTAILVTRHYSDYLGTTFDVVYSFTPNNPIKIVIKIQNGKADNYRLSWTPSGITKTAYTTGFQSLTFDTLVFDWSDVYYSLGNITQASVSDVAQGRKLDVAFNIGYLAAGQKLTIDPSIMDKNDATDGSETILYGVNWAAQTFTASSSYEAVSVELKLWRVGTPGDLTVSLTATSGGLPIAGDLCSGTISTSDITTSSPGDWYNTTFSSSYSVTNGTMYAIVGRVPSGNSSSNWIRWRRSGNLYSGGLPYWSDCSGCNGGWNSMTLFDNMFRVYGNPPSAPTVETDAATDVSYTTATLNGNITSTGGSSVTMRGFQWGTSTGNYTWAWNETAGYGTGAFSHGIDSLSVNTTYYFRAFAVNGVGTSYGSELDFTTLELSIPTVTNEDADGIGETTATFYGNITVTGGLNSSARGFEWGTSTGNYTEDWHEDGSYGIGVFNHTFSDLPPDTTIYWLAYATNLAGTGYSGELNFTTLLPLPQAPSNFTAIQTGVTTGNLTWAMGLYAEDVYIRGKEGEYPKDMTDGYLIYFGNETSVELTGLSLGLNTYCYRAWSSNPTGNSTGYAETKIGGESMLFMVFVILALGLTLGWVWRRDGFLAYAAAGAWLVLGIYCYGEAAVIWPISDIYGALFMIGMGMTITCALLPTLTRERPAPDEVAEQWEGEDLSSMGFDGEDKSSIQPLTRRQRYNRAMSRAARTGEVRTRG